jgi:hypothetical protein
MVFIPSSGNHDSLKKGRKKMRKAIWSFLMILMLFSLAAADVRDRFPRLTLPDSVAKIKIPEEVRSFIISRSFEDRRAGSIRLGQIGGEKALEMLIEAFEQEPYRPGIDAGVGIRRYILLSIGQIGGAKAENFTRNILLDYSPDFFGPRLWNASDSIDIMTGAFDALVGMDPPWLKAFMDTIFNSSGRDMWLRERAYAYMEEEFMNASFGNQNERVNYLIAQYLELSLSPGARDESGIANVTFIKYKAYMSLFYKYRDYSVPAFNEYLSKHVLDGAIRKHLQATIARIQGEPSK